MIDINAIITQALTAAVAEATKPLVARIAALEAKLAEQQAARPAPQVDAALAVEALNSREWFWEKVRRFADAAAEAHMGVHLEQASHFDEDDIDSKIEEAVEKHEEESSHIDDETSLRDAVEDILRDATIRIRL